MQRLVVLPRTNRRDDFSQMSKGQIGGHCLRNPSALVEGCGALLQRGEHLFVERMQVAQSHASVQRIAAYIRIMFEKDSEDLNWETGSYYIRRASLAPLRDGKHAISHNSPLLPIDWFLFASSVVAIVLAGFIALFTPMPSPTAQPTLLWPPVIYFGTIGFAALVWGAAWWRYGKTIRNLEQMVVDDRETEFWKKFQKE